MLVFGMLRPDGSVGADELYEMASACDLTNEQVRSCLRRLVTEGLLDREGTGRTALYRTTDRGRSLRQGSLARHQLAYRQDRRGQGWNGRWHLAAFAIPEEHRSSRDRLRDRLLDAGGAVINNGLYVSPHPWGEEVAEIAGQLHVEGRLTMASTDDLDIGGVRDARELAALLWPVGELAAAYRRFVTDHGQVVPVLEQLRKSKDRITDSDFMPGALRMVVAFQEVFLRDPLLPPELLPRPWPGRAARDLLMNSRRLALRLREAHERPALFAAFDDLLADGTLDVDHVP